MADAETAKARAEACFRPQSTETMGSTKQGIEDERAKESDKTARLRAMRLERERQDALAAEIRRARREQRRP